MDARAPRTVVVGTGPVAEAAAAELDALRVPAPGALAEPGVRSAGPFGLAVVVVGSADADGIVTRVLGALGHPRPRVLVVTERLELPDLARSLDAGHLGGVVMAPWTPGNLRRYADAQLARWVRRRGGRVAEVAEERPPEGEPEPRASGLLRHLHQDPDTAAAELLEAVESVLGPRPRLQLPPHVRLTIEDDDVGQLFLVLSGRVALSVNTGAGALTLHHASTGPLIGLVALTGPQAATVTARTTTDCEVVPLTVEQLDRALAREPRVGAALTALTVRALSARLRRAERLHVEKAELAVELQRTLRELEAARAGLVEQARMATLGETTAGVAHELSNPIAAVTRGVEHLSADLRVLLGGGGHQAVRTAFEAAETREAVPASAERSLRRELAGATGATPAQVRRLVAAGVTDAARARAVLAGPPEELVRVEAAAGIGATLRSLRTAADHVGRLVEDLRVHARPDDPDAPLEPTDVAATIQDALGLVEHRLAGLTVDVRCDDDLPPVGARPGRLAQVWANLLANAADALDGSGRITVRAQRADDRVRVEVEDDGPGVPPSLQGRIFEPRFTTKHGVVRSGLGLGLGISRSIVVQHRGTIGLESGPGRTVFTVDLPALPARTDARPSGPNAHPSGPNAHPSGPNAHPSGAGARPTGAGAPEGRDGIPPGPTEEKERR
ncbi:sensor histidine kinase [Ornithinimicrobium sp. W1679]|uniref:sensor histidine kinase n=1 Tax=Ornithinimicrobium sp. W1679 TaxID=3418770 RepID=UPI003CF6F8EE